MSVVAGAIKAIKGRCTLLVNSIMKKNTKSSLSFFCCKETSRYFSGNTAHYRSHEGSTNQSYSDCFWFILMFSVIRRVLNIEISLFEGFAEIRVNSEERNKVLPLTFMKLWIQNNTNKLDSWPLRTSRTVVGLLG